MSVSIVRGSSASGPISLLPSESQDPLEPEYADDGPRTQRHEEERCERVEWDGQAGIGLDSAIRDTPNTDREQKEGILEQEERNHPARVPRRSAITRGRPYRVVDGDQSIRLPHDSHHPWRTLRIPLGEVC